MRHEYGTKHPEGQLLATSCVRVRSFAPELRSAPQLHGQDDFVGYFDYGPGMSRGHVFLVAPVPAAMDISIGELLQAADPKRRPFWLEAKLTNGRLGADEPFEAYVPPKQHSPDPGATIVEREAVLIRGSLHSVCGKRYLVAVQGNPRITESSEWPFIRKHYDLFVSNIQWP